MSFLIVIPATILAGAIQNMAGFGAGIVTMLIFPYFFGIIGAAALNQAICTGMTIILAYRYRKWLDWRLFVLPVLAYLVTSLGILSILGDMDLTLLSNIFGVSLIVLSVYLLFFQKGLRIKPTSINAVLCGLVAGVFSGLFALGAPVIGLYYLSVTDRREVYMANLQLLFAVTNFAGIMMRISKGYFTTEMILPAIIGFCGLLVGQNLGERLSSKLDQEKFSRVVYTLVGITGVSALF